MTPSREAARSHSRGRRRGDDGCGTGPLARYRLAPRRREVAFGRYSDSAVKRVPNAEAIVRAGAAASPKRSPRCGMGDVQRVVRTGAGRFCYRRRPSECRGRHGCFGERPSDRERFPDAGASGRCALANSGEADHRVDPVAVWLCVVDAAYPTGRRTLPRYAALRQHEPLPGRRPTLLLGIGGVAGFIALCAGVLLDPVADCPGVRPALGSGACAWADTRARRKLCGCNPEPRSCGQRLSQIPSVFGQPAGVGVGPRWWWRARCLGCWPLGARAIGRRRRVGGAATRQWPPGRSRGRAACGCRSRRPAGSIPHLTEGSR